MTYFDYNLQQILVAIMISVRLGAMLMSLPFLSEIKIPMIMNITLPVVMGFLLAPSMPTIVPVEMLSHAGFMVLALLTEILTGVLIGFSVRIVMALANIAGEIAGIQIGFSMAAIFDPHFGQVSEVAYFNMIFVAIAFFVFDMHHAVIRTVVFSYSTVPIGAPFVSMSETVVALSKLFSMVFSLACRFAFPVVVAILMSHIINGLISVTAPQLNIYFNAAIALNIALGLGILVVSFGTLFEALNSALTQMQSMWNGIFGFIR